MTAHSGKLKVFLAVAIPLTVLYGFTRAPSVTGEDSGELITAAYTMGIAHPPGYPLWLCLTKVGQSIFQGLSPASASNLMSGLTTAGAMGIMAVVALMLTGSALASIAAFLFIGVGHEIWNHATFTEVYPLSLLILAASLLLFLRYREHPTRRNLFLLALIYGAGLTHHPTFVLLAPVLGLAVLWEQPQILRSPRSLGVGLLGLLLPFAIYAQVWIAAGQESRITWGVTQSFASVKGHFLREVYASAPDKVPMTVSKFFAQLGELGRCFVQEWTLVGCAAALVGLGLLIRHRRRMGLLVLAINLTTIFGVVFFTNFDVEREDAFVARVFLLPCYMVLGLGLAFLALTAVKRAEGSPAALLVLVPAILMGSLAFKGHDRSQYRWADEYGRQMLEGCPKDALLLPDGDTSTFPLHYLQACEGLRRDVDLLDSTGTFHRSVALDGLPEELHSQVADLPRDGLMRVLLARGVRPVVTLKRIAPLDPSSEQLVPCGFGFVSVRISDKQGKERLGAFQSQWLKDLVFTNETEPTVEDYTSDMVQGHLLRMRAWSAFSGGNPIAAVAQLKDSAHHTRGIKESHNNVGAVLAEHGVDDVAEEQFKTAIAIREDYTLARKNLLLVLRRNGKAEEAASHAVTGMKRDPYDQALFEEGVACALEAADAAALKQLCALRMEAVPEDPSPRQHLAKWAEEEDQDLKKARELLAEALEANPESEDVAVAMAELEERMGIPEDLRHKRMPSETNSLDALTAAVSPELPIDAAQRRRSRGRSLPGRQPSGFYLPGSEDLTGALKGGREAAPAMTAERYIPAIPGLQGPVGERTSSPSGDVR